MPLPAATETVLVHTLNEERGLTVVCRLCKKPSDGRSCGGVSREKGEEGVERDSNGME